ncbi:helix-turn-helix domain-containing protein [Alteromonas halophila]|uniref:AraC family transcriptional regulator n=1 Tax=Alteromonas halophila TaxID=516698 RepID=A0A918JJY0_9ALTE|nr:AraC family transcriptional regulator [Alteromonas halophila]GGW83454.1 AraC family transcriptional regulator [Alteromonas halophila]
MEVSAAYIVLLVSSIALMLAQLLVKQKTAENIVFAIFCGSLAMVSVKALSADLAGPYQYLIGLGTCATCNVIWLVARALFREKNAIQARHIGIAVVIALLVMLNQGLHFASATGLLPSAAVMLFSSGLGEITQLLSSTILLLTFWEAIRPQARQSILLPWQRYMFASAFMSGVVLCSVVISLFSDLTVRAAAYPYFVAFSALLILFTTQALLILKRRAMSQQNKLTEPQASSGNKTAGEAEAALASDMKMLFEARQLYLTANLKMIDIANALGVSEYKVSRAIRYSFDADNFSQLVNQYRIAHAKRLLTSTQSAHWSILVTGLESGFSSLSSFNRAFKAAEGCSPGAYRNAHSAQSTSLA